MEPKIINIAKVNEQSWLEESGQWLETVDRTHLDLASGKQVPQKMERKANLKNVFFAFFSF